MTISGTHDKIHERTDHVMAAAQRGSGDVTRVLLSARHGIGAAEVARGWFGAGAALAGAMAAVMPARRAAKLDVLEALAAE